MGRLIDLATIVTENRMEWFWFYTIVTFIIVVWNFPASLIRAKYQSRITRGVSKDLRVSICRQLQQLTLLYHDRHSIGRLQSKAIRDIEVLEQLPGQLTWLLFIHHDQYRDRHCRHYLASAPCLVFLWGAGPCFRGHPLVLQAAHGAKR